MTKLLIVDGNSLLHRAFYALPLLSSSEGVYTNAVFGFCNMLIKMINEQKPSHIVVAMDYERKTFRNELYSEYKANRSSTPEELGMQFALLEETLQTMGIKTIKIKGLEGDDIIGTLAKRFDVPTIVLTGDRDSLQLIDDSTQVWLTKKGISELKMMDTSALMEEYGVAPRQVIDAKALMGDKSDNIPGVKGIGEVGAYKLVREYGSLENIYNNLDNISKALRAKLENDKDMAFLSYKLATIKTDCDIECNLDECIYQFPFASKVKELFAKYQFSALLKKDNLFCKDTKIQEIVSKYLEGEEIEDFCSKIRDRVAIYIDQDLCMCTNENVECRIKFEDGLFAIEPRYIQCIQRVLCDDTIIKLIYDKKATKRMLKSKGFELSQGFDCGLAHYLLNASDKALDIDQFCLQYNAESKVCAIFDAYEILNTRLQEEGLTDVFYNIEMPLNDILYQMEEEGVKVDKAVLNSYGAKYDEEIAELTKQIHSYAGREFNINSPKQVAEVLYQELKLANKKSTSLKDLESIASRHEIVPAIIRYRKVVKVKNTYIDAFLKCEKDGYIHTTFNQMATATGRLSSSEPNMQSIPSKDDEARQIRNAFVSRFEDGELICADYNQIELRLMANFSNEPTMVASFLNNEDIHSVTASKIYNIPLEKVTREQRRNAKAVNFGIIYGQGAFGLSQGISTDFGTAKNFIDSYFATYPTLKHYIEDSIRKAKENNDTVYTIFNRKRHIPELSSPNHQLRSFGERSAINSPLQGSASDIIKLAMVRLSSLLKQGGYKSILVLQIHDELVIDSPKDEVMAVCKLIEECMTNVVELRVPLTVEVKSGKTLYK